MTKLVLGKDLQAGDKIIAEGGGYWELESESFLQSDMTWWKCSRMGIDKFEGVDEIGVCLDKLYPLIDLRPKKLRDDIRKDLLK